MKNLIEPPGIIIHTDDSGSCIRLCLSNENPFPIMTKPVVSSVWIHVAPSSELVLKHGDALLTVLNRTIGVNNWQVLSWIYKVSDAPQYVISRAIENL